MEAVLQAISNNYVALKDHEFKEHYNVFVEIFGILQEKMKQVDPYYNKYSSRKQFAGSHFDGLRIVKPDEFDMDIVISLPLNFDVNPSKPDDSDILIESKSPGYVQLKMGKQYQKLPYRDGGEWAINKIAFDWHDDKNYLLRSKFISWFKSVVTKALNTLEENSTRKKIVNLASGTYTIRLSESGPAITMIIEKLNGNFKLDVDFVPALKFPETRWPISAAYRKIPADCNKQDWLVVPKQNKLNLNLSENERSWRLAFHEQEKQFMHGLNNLKPTIRLMKKLRDTKKMDYIASYYIKTLFLWEIEARNNKEFWTLKISDLFKIMVNKFHDAMTEKKIPYFWNKGNNLIGGLSDNIARLYKKNLEEVISVLEADDHKLIAKHLLSSDEYQDFLKKYPHISSY